MKKNTYALFTSLTLISFCFVQAQTLVLNGKVINNESRQPMSNASIIIKDSKEGTVTDLNGNFRLTTQKKFPLVLIFSSIGFETGEVQVSSAKDILIKIVPSIALGQEIVVAANRVPTKLLESPVSIERVNTKQIIQNPALSYYDIAATLKGVDVTTASLNFKTISTRGFNGSGSPRVNQIVDGMDNQAPGLNFYVGNFSGLTELDVESMELLPGASSALYGPGGMNGTILINSKDPFKYQGLSIMAKHGVMNIENHQYENPTAYYDYSLRWAKVFNNRFAVKLGAQYISAKDWLAGDSSNYQRIGNDGKVKPATRSSDPNYDGVNVYGDETSVDIRAFMQGAIQQNPGLMPVLQPFLSAEQKVSRTGYQERYLVDPETKNVKLSAALHYKIQDKLELQLIGYLGTGNTVYTGNNRYVLKGIKIGQYKLELRHQQWFLRAYTTQEDAGDAYSATITAQYLNEAWKPSFNPSNINGSWYPQYTGAFIKGAATVFQQAFVGAKMAGKSDVEAMGIAQTSVTNAASQFHQAARAFADQGRPVAGSEQFKTIFDQVRKIPIPNGGRFLEKSQLWMAEGQYNFSDKIKFADFIVGANLKRYILNSDGTIFIDTSKAITINEIGAYGQVTKRMFRDKISFSISARYDKNEDFKGQFTPRATALISVAKDNNIRFSYQTAYRFASSLQKYISLDVGGYTLLGGLPWVMDYMNAYKYPVFEVVNNTPASTPYVFKEFKPEKLSSFELGYKGLIANHILIDAYGYVGKYTNFIGRNVLLQQGTGNVFVTAVNSSNKINAHGFGLGLDYRLPHNYSLFLNAYTDVLEDFPNGFLAYFNTPKYRLNAGFGNAGVGKSKRIGFNVVVRWQDAFNWEGELANGPVDAFSTVDAQVNYQFPKIRSMVKIGGSNIFNHYYQNGFGNPQIGGLYYIGLAYNVFNP